MITSPKNRVQEIKNRFENLNNGNASVQRNHARANIPLDLRIDYEYKLVKENIKNYELGSSSNEDKIENESDSSEEGMPKPNISYLYGKNVNNSNVSESKSSLTRKISDPGKKLHRSHAFRCDKSQKIGGSPKRHGSCNGRSETSDFTLKMDKKLSKERRMILGNFLELQMQKENFIPKCASLQIVAQVNNIEQDSIPNSEVPQHILNQYATVNKSKKIEIEKHEALTDSGVCSETENTDEDKNGRLKRLLSQFEKPMEDTSKSNLDSIEFCDSSETIRLERKNPHLKLTDTLKKALKQPLPPGPPPQKPPRTFVTIPENIETQKNETKRKLEKLEQVLKKHEQTGQTPKVTMKKPKEIHYLCTEIIDITNRTLLPNQNSDPITRCLNSLNCAITNNSTSSLPYTRMMSEPYTSKSPIIICCSCSNNSLDSQFKDCIKCNSKSANDRFKSYLNSNCRVGKSEFYVKQQEHIYDEPCNDSDYLVQNKYSGRKNKYGTLNALKNCKSMDDLRPSSEDDRNIYSVAYEPLRFPTPEPSPMSQPENVKPNFEESQPRLDFEKLRRNFETGSVRNSFEDNRKLKPILMAKIREGKSTESLSEEFKSARKNVEKKFATEVKKYKKGEGHITFSLPKEDTQLDLDKENLNCLMNEIYDTVTAVCNMDDNKPGSFPTEHSDGSTSEDSVKLTRSLTEKRKNYVRRVSTRVAYLDPKNIKTARFRHQTSVCSFKFDNDNPYSTFRSWKSFRTSQGSLPKMERDDSKVNLTDSRGNILSMNDFDSTDSLDKMSIDEKAGCLDIKLPFEPRERGLFNLCVLVGLNYMTGQAYVKSVFPSQVPVPPHIENLVFPETMSEAPRTEWSALAASQQCYSLVLTDERGERSYGYCRRVLPECATTCLPLLYCLIGRYRAPGFYYKVLEEIETHHGISDLEIHSILQQLFETDFPNPGEEITIIYNTERLNTYAPSEDRSKTLPDMRRTEGAVNEMAEASSEAELTDYYDIENNNGKRVGVNLGVKRIKKIKRPIEPRADEDNLSVLLDLLGAGLVIKVFSCLLLERKVIIVGDRLRDVSSCVEALQSSLYPFVWQHTLISSIPAELHRELLEAPLPILAGMLHIGDQLSTQNFEEGMLIDLTHPSKVLFCHGDESTILPSPSFKTLKTSLKMETGRIRSEDTKTRNVMISEAFMRLFVDILGDFWRFFRVTRKDEERELEKRDVVFDKEAFIKSTSSKENQFFLEWFTETAMFNHFIQNMSETHRHQLSKSQHSPNLVDTPLPNFYELFHERVRCRTSIISKNLDSTKNNYKNAVNKKIKFLKSKLRELVA